MKKKKYYYVAEWIEDKINDILNYLYKEDKGNYTDDSMKNKMAMIMEEYNESVRQMDRDLKAEDELRRHEGR